ncbi:hypothetical protein D3C80_1529950 [compost metagenome]
MVSPLDQRFPSVADEVNITLPPSQKVVDPVTEIVGLAGFGITVVTTASDVRELQPLLTLTV